MEMAREAGCFSVTVVGGWGRGATEHKPALLDSKGVLGGTSCL